MSIEEFRGLVEQVGHLESEIQLSRDRAEDLPLTLSQKLQTLRRITSEYEITIKENRNHVNLDFLTDAEREWHALYSEQPDAIRNRVTTVLIQIESRITSDQALFRSLTSEEHAWIIEKVGSFEVVKQGMNGRELRGGTSTDASRYCPAIPAPVQRWAFYNRTTFPDSLKGHRVPTTRNGTS